MSKLREAAQAVIAAKSTSDMVLAMERLRDALAEDRWEYALWGTINGSPGGRWVSTQSHPNEIWPPGTALYVRRGQE